MLLLKYIRDHVPFCLTVVGIYGIVFLTFLTAMSEIFFSHGYNESDLQDSTYRFQVYEADFESVRELPMIVDNYEDICVYSMNEDSTLIAYITDVSEMRSNSAVCLPNGTDEVKTDSGILTQSLLDEDHNIMINGNEYRVTGTIDLDNGFDNMTGTVVYCSTDLFEQLIDNDDPMIISVLFDNRLKKDELEELKEQMYSVFGANTYIPPTADNKALSIITGDDMRVLLLLGLIGGVCFAKLLVAIIQNREPEFNVLRICGASENKIDQMIFDHILFVLILSEIIGTALFVVIKNTIPGLVAYKGGPFFYLISYVVFLIIAVITFWSVEIIRRYRYGDRNK